MRKKKIYAQCTANKHTWPLHNTKNAYCFTDNRLLLDLFICVYIIQPKPVHSTFVFANPEPKKKQQPKKWPSKWPKIHCILIVCVRSDRWDQRHCNHMKKWWRRKTKTTKFLSNTIQHWFGVILKMAMNSKPFCYFKPICLCSNLYFQLCKIANTNNTRMHEHEHALQHISIKLTWAGGRQR